MINQRDNNPHFVTPPLSPPPPASPPRPQPSSSSSRRPKRTSSRANKQPPPPPDPPLTPPYVTPQPQSQPQPYLPKKEWQRYQPPPEAPMHPIDGQLQQQQPQQPGTTPNSGEPVPPQEPQLNSAGNRPQQPQQNRGRHNSGQQGQSRHHRHSSLRVPGSRKTKPLAWLIAALCTLFWIIVIVGGLAILIIYLIFRPHLPKFDISSATLNAAYLDMGKLNADFTILGNFTNPNKKVNVDFHYVVLDLYQNQALLARRYLDPFTTMKRHSRFVDIHMIVSQVPLTLHHSQDLRRQMANGRAMFDVKGVIRARSNLGFLRYSYWLYSHCTITVTGPPTGVMIAKTCTTKG